MTTNVTDICSGKMASDSRWSINHSDFIMYIDNAGCEKIVIYRDYGFIFAGNGDIIQKWKDWISGNPKDHENHPEVENLSVCIADLSSGKVEFHNFPISTISACPNQLLHALFAGTGAESAKACWQTSRDANRAVETAMETDIFSGGEVKYVVFSSRANNLNQTSSISEVTQKLAKEGFVMYKTANKSAALPVLDAAKKDEKVQELLSGIAKGSIVANAPCNATHQKWTGDKIMELKNVLKKIF